MSVRMPNRVYEGSDKRQRMDLSQFPGMNNMSTNGGSYDPSNMDKTVGTNGNWGSGTVNSAIEVKIVGVPPKYGRKWLNEYPLNCVLFGTATQFTDDMKQLKNRGRERIFRQIDCMELFTLEQMNYVMHQEWARLDPKYPESFPTLEQLFNKWKCVGVNTSPPTDSSGTDTYFSRRIGEERVIVVRPIADEKVVNYWGAHVGGVRQAHLYFVLKMVNMRQLIKYLKTMYILSRDGHDNRMENFYFKNEKGAPTSKPIHMMPHWEAVSSDNPRRPDLKDLQYRDEYGEVQEGFFIKFGRVVVNPAHKAQDKKQIESMGDMKSTYEFPLIDVIVNINEGYHMAK